MTSQEPSMDPASARDSSPDYLAIRSRSKRKRQIIGSAVATLLVLGVTTAVISAQRAARRELEAGVNQLRACLMVGPLDPKESASLRYRRLQLYALTRSDTERATNGARSWPLNCRESAGRVAGLLKDTASEAEQKSLAGLVALLSNGEAISKDASELIEPVFALLDKTPTAPIPAGRPLPPAVPNTDTLASTIGLSKKGLSRSFTEDNPGLTLPVLIDEEDLPAPLLCVFRASGGDAECRSLTELKQVHGHGLRMLGTSDPDANNLVFAGRRGTEGVFVTGSDKPIDRMYSYGGYSARDGSVSVLGWDVAEKNMVLTQKIGSAAPVRTPLKPNFRVGNFFYGSQLLWDQVLVRGITPDDERRLFALPLSQNDKHSFALVDIGELPEPGLIRPGEEEQPHLTGCRTAQATMIRVRGRDNDFLTFRINDRFSDPVFASPVGVLGCYGTTATVVYVSHGKTGATRLYHDTCNSAGCLHAVLDGDALDGKASDLRPEEPSDVAAVDLDGKLLAVWHAGERGGLRMRMGEPDKFARAESVMLFDDHVAEGKTCRDSTLLGFRLYSREHFALLLLSTMAGVHAFRIEPNGSVTPWKLKAPT